MNGHRGAAAQLEPGVCAVLGVREIPVRLVAWDGSGVGPVDGPRLVLRSRRALRRLLWAPGELGFGRAYVSGDLDIDGDIFAALSALRPSTRLDGNGDTPLTWRERAQLLAAAVRLGAVGPNPAPPPEEIRLTGRQHGPNRDQRAVSHHYDVGNEFYRLVLGPTMLYSCAYFPSAAASLDEAQVAKLDLIATKLDLAPGQRLLDVGCGWGSLAIHAAKKCEVDVVGITLSHEQAELARKRVAEAGLTDQIEIRVQDYRDVDDGPYDAVSSIGMAEHVGSANMAEYARRLHDLLRPGGRLLNQAISWSRGETSWDGDTFISRYVFPDGELITLGATVIVLEESGLEVLTVQALRPHYARTLRAWVQRLEDGWSEAVRLTSEGRARVWRLYMAGSALSFEDGTLGVNQVLAVRPDVPARASS
ncbi:MAG: cyclopropane-fatty-acyl-phospholipid synthase family protein [Actinomycetota bacterium]|nr:cyclopropane-fatty-acyl-phospholipid synthase family protein [Actinomycetota bacterium]